MLLTLDWENVILRELFVGIMFVHVVHTIPEVRQTSYIMGNGGYFPGYKAAGAWS
jgi:hypothetical protein